MLGFSLKDLIAPLPTADFFAEHFGNAPAFIGGATDKFTDLWSWEDFNALLAKTRHWTENSCSLTRDGLPLPVDQYCYDSLKRDQIGIQRPDFEQVGAAVRDGAALHLDRVETMLPALAAATANLRSALGAEIIARLTYSRVAQPMCNTRFETNDILLIQLEGEQSIRLFDGCFENPCDAPGFCNETIEQEQAVEICGEVAAELPLTQGDLLYLPAGQYYDATAGSTTANGASAQLRYIISRPSGLDFAAFLLGKLTDDALFRADMPFFDDKEALEKHVRHMAERIGLKGQAEDFGRQFREQQMHTIFRSPLSPIGFPDTGTIHRYRQRNVPYSIALDGEDLRLTGPRGEETISPRQQQICSWLTEHDFFEVREVTQAFPNEKSAEDIIAKLCTIGILQAV